MQDLTGRTAVVTGGGSGIGRGISLGLAAEGMRVAVLDLNGEAAATVAGEIDAKGGQALPVAVDVTSSEALKAAAKEVAQRFGGVDVLCANAGVMLPLGPLTEKSESDWEYVFSVNVHGVVKTVDAFLAQLRAAKEAHIVNTASLGGIVSVPQVPLGVYISSKYAVVGYSECLRFELSSEGIGVSVLCPGVVQSELYHTSASQRPERFGGPQTVDAAPGDPTGGAGVGTVTPMPAEEVGPIVVRAIRENRLHIFTHPASLPLAEARFESIRADYEAEAKAQGES
jgi:NAD(P)-dependent dehydrogenase (short-subunit alcohol dehydrogenase family)